MSRLWVTEIMGKESLHEYTQIETASQERMGLWMCFTFLHKERVARTGASPTLTRFEVAHPFAPGLQAARPIENIESCFAERNGANQNTRRCELW